MSDALQLTLGVLLGLVMAVGGYAKRALSRNGAIAAALIGAIIFGLGGWAWGILLVAFFVTSSALSLYSPRRKAAIAAEKFSKGHRRDVGQVLANGGWAALLALLAWRLPGNPWLFPALVGALGTVNADTWATELGTLSRTPPRLITTGREVPPGTSGGLTVLGTLASLGGGLLIGALATLLAWLGGASALSIHPAWLSAIGAVAGLAGSLTDSLLGATVQQLYVCPHCQSETEKRVHGCGTATTPLRGWSWMDNDVVNAIASIVGSAVAVGLASLAR